jgi:hypothetical protein
LGGALFTFSLLGFYALLNTSISQHDLESMLIGKVLCLFHFNAFMVDVISSLVTREQGLFLVLASPHFYLFCGFVGFVLKFIWKLKIQTEFFFETPEKKLFDFEKQRIYWNWNSSSLASCSKASAWFSRVAATAIQLWTQMEVFLEANWEKKLQLHP